MATVGTTQQNYANIQAEQLQRQTTGNSQGDTTQPFQPVQSASMQPQARSVDANYFNDGRAESLKPQNITQSQLQQSPQLVASELERAQQVLAHRQQSGLDTSAQQNYINQLNSYKTQQTTQQSQTTQSSSDYLAQMKDFLTNSSQAQVQQQQAALQLQKDQALKEIENAFNQAVADGELSVKEAERLFEEQKKQIELKAYQDAQVTNVTAQNRGIQNSQQLLGMQAGDNARTNSLKNESLTARDTRVFEIQNRIKQLGLQRSLEISGVNSQFQQGVISAEAQAQQQLNNQLFTLNSQIYEMDRQEKFEFEKMAKQYGYDLEKMNAQQRLELEAMAKQHGYQVALENLGFKNQSALQEQGFKQDLTIQQNNFGHDLTVLDKNFQHDFTMQDKNFNNQVSLENLGYSNSSKLQQQQAATQAQQDEQARLQALQWRLEEEKEGTLAYDVRQAEEKRAAQEAKDKANSQALAEFSSQELMYYLQNPPKQPVRSDFNKLLDSKAKEDKKYKEALEAYKKEKERYDKAMAQAKKYGY